MNNIFIPPSTDKIINRGGREKVPVYLFVDPDEPSILYIDTKEDIEIKNNSIYELNISTLNFSDGDSINKYKHTFLTSPSPIYVSVDDVLTLCKNLPIPIEDVLYYIKEASKIADYWAYHDSDGNTELNKIFNIDNIKEDYYPFYMFVKYKAVANCVRSFYMKVVSQPYKFRDILSDLERDEEMDLDALKHFLDDLDTEAEDWLELVVVITADPQWALRGKYSYAIMNQAYKPYHPTLINRQGWDRGY